MFVTMGLQRLVNLKRIAINRCPIYLQHDHKGAIMISLQDDTKNACAAHPLPRRPMGTRRTREILQSTSQAPKKRRSQLTASASHWSDRLPPRSPDQLEITHLAPPTNSVDVIFRYHHRNSASSNNDAFPSPYSLMVSGPSNIPRSQ